MPYRAFRSSRAAELAGLAQRAVDAAGVLLERTGRALDALCLTGSIAVITWGGGTVGVKCS